MLFICNQLEAMVHPFFDELRDPNTCLPNGRPLPPLFNFKAHGKNHFNLSLYCFICPNQCQLCADVVVPLDQN